MAQQIEKLIELYAVYERTLTLIHQYIGSKGWEKHTCKQ